MSNETRDCKNCIHKVPVFDEEEGIWRGAECDAWECNFVDRAEALRAFKELQAAREVLETIKERYILLEKSPRDNPNDLLVAKMPDRPQGQWIEQTDFEGEIYYECSVCKETWYVYDGAEMSGRMNYCPVCGAKMGGLT